MTKTTIKNIDIPSSEEWDEIWNNCDFSTFFHSREWAEIWNIYTNGKCSPCPKIIIFSDGKKALIPLSVQLEFKGLVKTYTSSPPGTFGGWISTDNLSIEHANLIVKYLLNEFPNLFSLLNPYDNLVSKLNIPSSTIDHTYSFDLSEGLEAILKKWRQQRSRLKFAINTGVSVRLANTKDDWDSYYNIYKDSLKRWGKKTLSTHKKELFDELFNRKSSNIKLWLAIYENKIIAGNIIFYSKNHVVGWHAAALDKYFKTRMMHLIFYTAIQHANENGYRWYDFNPCGGLENVRQFKKGFGTNEIPFPVINKETKFKKTLNITYEIIKKFK